MSLPNFLCIFLIPFFSSSTYVLYYQRFIGNDFPSYDLNYQGSSEVWPSSSYVSSQWTCDSSALIGTSQNFCNWGGWSSSNSAEVFSTSSLVQMCGTYKVFGGYDKLKLENITKVFTVLPTHTQVTITFDLFMIDTWGLKSFFLYLDGTQVLNKKYDAATCVSTTNLCGGAANDCILPVSVAVPHTANTLSILFFTDNDAIQSAFYGIHNLKVFLTNDCTSPCLSCSPSASQCSSCHALAQLSAGTCTCKKGFYLDTSTYLQCLKCHISCKACSAGTANDCSECYTNNTLTGTSCVPKTGIFLFLSHY